MNHYPFDFETAKVLAKNADLQAQMPLYVTCAAGLKSTDLHAILKGNTTPDVWFAGMSNSVLPGFSPNYSEKMSPAEIMGMLRTLAQMHLDGFPISTWNGVGFEFLELGHETGLWQEVKILALLHYDFMFQLLRQAGYFVSFDRAMRGMGLPGKGASEMTGADAPAMWLKMPEKVLEYVQQDVIQPAQFAERTAEYEHVIWAFKRADGIINEDWHVLDYENETVLKRRGFGSTHLGSPDLPGWLPVWEVFHLPPPDVGGFTNPPPTIWDVAHWILELPELTPSAPWGLQPELKDIGIELDREHIRPLRERLPAYDDWKERRDKSHSQRRV